MWQVRGEVPPSRDQGPGTLPAFMFLTGFRSWRETGLSNTYGAIAIGLGVWPELRSQSMRAIRDYTKVSYKVRLDIVG